MEIQPASVARMRIRLVIRRLRVRPPPGRQYSFEEINLIFPSAILSLPLIQEGQLIVSFWWKNVHNTGYTCNRLEDSLPSKSVV